MERGGWLEEGEGALSKKASLCKTLRSTSPFRRQLFSLLEESEEGETSGVSKRGACLPKVSGDCRRLIIE